MNTAAERIRQILARRGFDNALGRQLAHVIASELELGRETYTGDSAVYRWVSAWHREPAPSAPSHH